MTCGGNGQGSPGSNKGIETQVFFHVKASARHKKNSIEGIMDANEVWHEDDDKVEEVVVEYYKELFTTSHPTEFSELIQVV